MLNAAKYPNYAVIFPGILRTNVITSSLSRLASLIGLSAAPISQRSGFKSQQAYLSFRLPFGNCITCVFIWDLMIVFAYIYTFRSLVTIYEFMHSLFQYKHTYVSFLLSKNGDQVRANFRGRNTTASRKVSKQNTVS